MQVVQGDGAQAPVVVLVPFAVARVQMEPKPLLGLKLMRPKEHAFVPVDCSGGHEYAFSWWEI